MNYERLDPLDRGFIGSDDGATVWWCNSYEAIWVIEFLRIDSGS